VLKNFKGKGSFGKVYKCIHKTLNRVFALKIIETIEEENYNLAIEEAKLL
jgi:serine/threonine protein kinase